MQNLDDKLNNMKIPSLKEGSVFEKKLSNEIKRDIILKKTNYKLRFELVSVAASLLIIINLFFFFKPNLLNKFNQPTANEQHKIKNITKNNSLISSKEITYEDIDGSELVKHIPKNQIKKENTYIVRKYQSQGNGVITVVSEYDKRKNREKIMKLVDSSM